MTSEMAKETALNSVNRAAASQRRSTRMVESTLSPGTPSRFPAR